MKKILLIFLIFSAKTIFSQTPDKKYEFKITAKNSGDDVLAIGSTLKITEDQGVNWYIPINGGSFSIDGETTGFSKSGNDITVNFNLPRNIYGHSGTMRINLSAKVILFYAPSIDYTARQRIGTYYFEEIIDYGSSIIISGEYECLSAKNGDQKIPIKSNLHFKENSLEYTDDKGNQRIEFVEVKNNIYGFPNGKKESTGVVMKYNLKFGTFVLTENKLTIFYLGVPRTFDFKIPKYIEDNLRKENEQEDNSTILLINTFIKNDDPKSAKELEKKLHFPNSEVTNRINESLNTKDKKLITSINNLISEKKITEAVTEYSKLYSFNSSLRLKIQAQLEEYSKLKVDSLKEEAFDKFIKDNLVALKQLPLGKHTIKTNLAGRYFIDNNTEKIYLGKLDQISELKYGDFVVKIPSGKSFEITTNIEKDGNVINATGEKRYLYKNNFNNKIYRRKFRNCNSFESILDSEYPKNRVTVLQPQKSVTRIETSFDLLRPEKKFSTAIDEKKAENKVIEQIKIHRKFRFKAFSGITVLTSGLFWGTLRVIEMSKIP
jgi:hypothetical protein